jgi:hypothetical protein
MWTEDRVANYRRQRGSARLTPKQVKRANRKELSRARRAWELLNAETFEDETFEDENEQD